jgi:hypothetical protein
MPLQLIVTGGTHLISIGAGMELLRPVSRLFSRRRELGRRA